MAKRSPGLERRPHDTYDTPFKAVLPLIPFLPRSVDFIEPCAGRGDLVDHLQKFGHTCISKSDLHPRRDDIRRASAFSIRVKNPGGAIFITNPPWTREVMHPMIRHLAQQLPTWLLFDADWFHTEQAIPLLPYCHKMVSIGRVRWIEDTDSDGKDNAAWYYFDGQRRTDFVEAYGRKP